MIISKRRQSPQPIDLDRLKSLLNLADLVAEQHPLTGSGRYRSGQKHDSLVIDTSRNMYWWNSKTESGDILDWVGRYHCDYGAAWNSHDPAQFKEAVRVLARLAGQPEPEFKPEDPEQRRQRLDRQRLRDLATTYYHDQFTATKAAQLYAYGRGFSRETCAKFRLGYSDGKLIEQIPVEDRGLALDLGLLAERDGRRFDAIPADCLIYPHQVRGQVKYLSGRTIEGKKRHHNQHSPKEVFWAIPKGYGGDLVIVEGQADALSLAQWGLAAVALCGVNLAALDADLIKLFKNVFILVDNDPAGAESLDKLAKTIGPLVYLVDLPEQIDDQPIKDANDLLRAGVEAETIKDFLSQAKTYLDHAIKHVLYANNIDYDDRLLHLFECLAQLEGFQLVRYRTQVCRDLALNRSDFDRYLTTAKNQTETDNLFFKGEQYLLQDGWTVFKQQLQYGKLNYIPLANADIKITELVERDNGSGDVYREYTLAGKHANGYDLSQIAVPTTDFAGMNWVAEQWPMVIVGAGRGVSDALREAIQHLSGEVPRRKVYEHTGWRQIGEEWVYLTPTGALGLNNPDLTIEVDLTAGRSESYLKLYGLPLQPDGLNEAIIASLGFWNLTDYTITIPQFAATYLAPLGQFLPIDFGLWVHGKSGSFKSVIAALAQAHYGGWTGRDAKSKLPANFISTANNILMNAFMVKDSILVIDDYAPGNTIREMRERDEVASRLLRSVGNRAARGRMKDGRRFQADFPPRCLAVVTAEDVPAGQSILARGIGVRVYTPPKGSEARRQIEARLHQAQTVDAHFYPHAMSAYILWIKRHWEHLANDLPAVAIENQKKFASNGHARLNDAFGRLLTAIDTALYFFQDAGVVSDSQAHQRRAIAFDALQAVMHEHAGQIEALDPCTIFAETLREELDAETWYLHPYKEDIAANHPPQPYAATKVGWIDDAYIYLLPKSINAIIEAYAKRGVPFPVGRNTLYNRLQEKGWLLNASTTEYIPAAGTSPRVLKLLRSTIYPEETSQEQRP